MTANGSSPTSSRVTSTAWPRPSGSPCRTYAKLIRFEILRISSSCSRLAARLEERLELDRDVEVILDGVLAAAGDEDDVVDARGDRFFDAVLDDRLVDERQHFLGLRLGRRQEAGAEAGGGKDGFANGVSRGIVRRGIRSVERSRRDRL